MQCCIREDGVETALELQRLGACEMGFDAPLPCRPDHGGRGIDADDLGSSLPELRREGTVAAADVQDALAGPGGKELDQIRSVVADETRVPRVSGGLPGIGRPGPPFRHSEPALTMKREMRSMRLTEPCVKVKLSPAVSVASSAPGTMAT